MILAAASGGYAIGSLPTAGLIARLWGIDLRRIGSRNPGTHNALRNGGLLLAALVLVVEAAKGYGAVWLGDTVADDLGAVVAGIGAVAGNVYNVWYRFQGGKGLGISLGVLAAVWPAVLPFVIGVIVLTVIATRSSGIAALSAMAGLFVSAVLWSLNDWPTGGLAADPPLLLLATGMVFLMFWKHWRDARLRGFFRRRHRRPASPGHR